jgi:hypothetical protein
MVHPKVTPRKNCRQAAVAHSPASSFNAQNEINNDYDGA